MQSALLLESVLGSGSPLWHLILAVLPVWVFGAFIGLLLPRPKWLSAGLGSRTALLFAMPPGAGYRRFVIGLHGLVLLKELWYYFTSPGTFRRFCYAIFQWCCGKGFNFNCPSRQDSDCTSTEVKDKEDSWYVTEKDLAFFQYCAEENGVVKGAGNWEQMIYKDIPNVIRYTAWRRTLANGKTEYKSDTICPDATAEEFMDLYLDDDFRPKWDEMITNHAVIENGDFASRQQVVTWLRAFPFAFLSDRAYCIARRLFRCGSTLYGITKGIDHPNFAPNPKVVRMDVFYSMWASKNVECPWNSGKPACQTLLLHHEQFKIPENLARFAVRHGMWGFVRKMSERVPAFVQERRSRVDPLAIDEEAYGARETPGPLRKSMTSSTIGSCSSDNSDMSTDGSPDRGGVRMRRVKSLMALAVAGGVALLVNRSSSSAGGQGRKPRRHQRMHHASSFS